MLEVAIGWEVYALHRSALDLGWIGLAEFVPLFVLALPAGQLADRVPAAADLRRLAAARPRASASAWRSSARSGTTEVWPYLALAVGAGVAMALGWPAARAMPPTLVERRPAAERDDAALDRQPGRHGHRSRARRAAVRRLARVSCTCSRPARACVSARIVMAMHPRPAADVDDDGAAAPPSVESVLEGLRFVRPDRRSCSARSCSTCSRCCSAARWRCCRCSPARSCTSGHRARGAARGAGGRGAAGRGVASPAIRSAAAPAGRCCSWSACTARASSCSGSRACS